MQPCTIIIPCYNESARLGGEHFLRFVTEHPRVGFLFVDDGSTDDTAAVLESLCSRCPSALDWFSLPQNSGKGEAVRLGINRALEAEADYVGFFDADLATPLSEVNEFLAILDAHPDVEMVFGSRVNLLGRRVRRKLWRHYIGRVFATTAAAILRVPIYDTQCGAKLFRADDAVRDIFSQPFTSRWIFDVEILARLVARHRQDPAQPDPVDIVYERPVVSWYDVHGSKLRPRDALIVWSDLWRIYRKYLRS